MIKLKGIDKCHETWTFRILLGILVYGSLNFLSNKLLLPSAPFIALRPQIALPMAMGIVYGPCTGFIIGLVGNIFGDTISGYPMLKFWNWHIANGLIGLIPGLIRYAGIREIKTARDFGTVELTVVLSSGLAVGFAVLMDLSFIHNMLLPASLNSWILPAFITDAVNGLILLPILLFIWRRFVVNVETRTMVVIVSLLSFAVLITAITITWAVWDDLVSKESAVESFYSAGIVSLFVLILGVTVSVFMARRVTDPVMRLKEAAASIERGDYDTDSLDVVSNRSDEFGQLSRVFQQMASKIHSRENKLKQEVKELRIEIDKVRQAEEVAEIVETDYFKELRKKAKEFRKG